jgi:hypothetical protein
MVWSRCRRTRTYLAVCTRDGTYSAAVGRPCVRMQRSVLAPRGAAGTVGRDLPVVQRTEITPRRERRKVVDELARAAEVSPMHLTAADAVSHTDEDPAAAQIRTTLRASFGPRLGPAAARATQVHEGERYTRSNECSIGRGQSSRPVVRSWVCSVWRWVRRWV